MSCLRRAGARLSIAALVVSTLALPARDARAGGPVRLTWRREAGAETCLSAVELASRVTARLGTAAFSDRSRRTIAGVVRRTGSKWSAHIDVRDSGRGASGSREISSESPDCDALDAAVTLAIALAIDPEAALKADPVPAPAPAPPPPSAPAAKPEPLPTAPPRAVVCAPPPPPPSTPGLPAAAPPERPPIPARSPRWEAITTARAVVAGGLLPMFAPGAAVSAVFHAPRPVVHPTMGIALLPERPVASGQFAFGLTAGWLGACGSVVARRMVSLDLCGSVLSGDLHAVVRAAGLNPDGAGDRFWIGLSTSSAMRLHFGPVALETGAELVVPLTRSRFAVRDGIDPVFQQMAVGGVGFLGLGVSTR